MKFIKKFYGAFMSLRLFTDDTNQDNRNTQKTSSAGLSAEMKEFYEKRLLQNAEPKLVHDQFADKYPIPANNGKTIKLRRYSALPKALVALTEGVTPPGNTLNVNEIGATVDQYGDFIQMADMLLMTAIDNNLVQATKLLGSQAGRTLDTVTREVLAGAAPVRYAPKINGSTVTPVASRADLDASAKITPDLVFKAAADLNAMNADTIGDSFVAIIHPYAAYDLMRNDEWISVHQYARPDNIYKGEIGMLGNVRFIESSEAKIFGPGVIAGGLERLTVKTNASSAATEIYVTEKIGDGSAQSSLSIPVYINGVANTVTAIAAYHNTNGTKLTISALSANVSAGAVICGRGAGKDGSAVFSTVVLGAHAYATTEVEGGGLRHIVKQLGYGDDPLDQRSSAGWKATKVAHLLNEEFLVRIEHGSAYSATAKSN